MSDDDRDDSPEVIALALEHIKNPAVRESLDLPAVTWALQDIGCRLFFDKQSGGKSKLAGGAYIGTAHWVLEHGRRWEHQPLTEERTKEHGVKMGERKMCYSNSAEAAIEHPSLVYVEGLATGLIGFNHAWNAIAGEAPNGMIDLTLRTGPERVGHGPTYWGAAFRTEYVLAAAFRRECYGGLIDDWEADWPLLRDAVDLGDVLDPRWA